MKVWWIEQIVYGLSAHFCEHFFTRWFPSWKSRVFIEPSVLKEFSEEDLSVLCTDEALPDLDQWEPRVNYIRVPLMPPEFARIQDVVWINLTARINVPPVIVPGISRAGLRSFDSSVELDTCQPGRAEEELLKVTWRK